MQDDAEALKAIAEPEDYFTGIGQEVLPIPQHILLFLRTTSQTLQQEAMQHRSHHRHVLAFNLETSGNVHVDNLVLPLAPGQSLMILPFQFHHFSHLTSPHIKWLFCTFELSRTTFLEPLRNRVIQIGKATGDARSALLSTWHRGAADGWADDLQESLLQVSLMRLLLTLRQDMLTSAPDLPPPPKNDLLRTINRLMMESRGRRVVVADLADELGMSVSRLRVRFRETAGITLGSYIQNYRIMRAMALLRTTRLPITEVAIEAGFGSPQAFSRIFKLKTHQTPRRYRAGQVR